jgi:hypothetical protein
MVYLSLYSNYYCPMYMDTLRRIPLMDKKRKEETRINTIVNLLVSLLKIFCTLIFSTLPENHKKINTAGSGTWKAVRAAMQ